MGLILGEADAATGRIPAHPLGSQAGQGQRDGILVKPSNLLPAPPQNAVSLAGVQVSTVQLSSTELLQLHTTPPLAAAAADRRRVSSWVACQVPAMLGVPLALKQLSPTHHGNRIGFESPAVYLLIDAITGFAPSWVQLDGLGPILIARTDGLDFTVNEFWQLHDYNCDVMNRWSDWAEEGVHSPAVAAQRWQALTPQAFADYTLHRRQPDEDEDEDEDVE